MIVTRSKPLARGRDRFELGLICWIEYRESLNAWEGSVEIADPEAWTFHTSVTGFKPQRHRRVAMISLLFPPH